jgi:Icc-related predicted phosphoesterase
MIEKDNINIFGSTIWTNCNNRDPKTIFDVSTGIWDYTRIKNFDILKMCDIYDESISKLKLFLDSSLSQKNIIISHHAPSFKSIDKKYQTYGRINYGFYSDLDWLISEYSEKIPFWVHGHTHTPVKYNILGSTILSNPKGYPSEQSAFNPPFKIKWFSV